MGNKRGRNEARKRAKLHLNDIINEAIDIASATLMDYIIETSQKDCIGDFVVDMKSQCRYYLEEASVTVRRSSKIFMTIEMKDVVISISSYHVAYADVVVVIPKFFYDSDVEEFYPTFRRTYLDKSAFNKIDALSKLKRL